MIHDIKPPLNLPSHPFWIILGILLFLAAAGYFLLRRKKNTTKPPMAIQSPWEKACQALLVLEKSSLLSQSRFKEFYSELSDIVRHYFEERFHYHAPEMTTEEFLLSLKSSDQLNSKQQETLKEFLTSCDMVKFAKYVPAVDEGKKSLQLAKQLIEETKPVVPVSG